MDLLLEESPGLSEADAIRRMSPIVREFLRDASEEDPFFLDGYILPTLEGYECPEDKIVSDLSGAISFLELEEIGIAGYEDRYALGDLGGFFKKIKKAVKKVAKKVAAPIKKVHEKITPKPILNVQKKAAKVVKKAHKVMEKTHDKIEHVTGQIGKKYGDILITVAGAVLAPFTGGASLAAASALVAAHQAYQKKRNADQAKKMAKANAGQLQAEAAQQQAAATAQMDQFYQQNQAWFIQHGITPSQWASMTFDQKVAALNSGMGSGAAPSGGSASSGVAPISTGGQPPSAGTPPSAGPISNGATPGGGGGGGGGMPSYDSGMMPSAQQPTKVATAGMFDSSMLPLLAGGAILALIFGKPVKGSGRKTKRNPGRRRRRVA